MMKSVLFGKNKIFVLILALAIMAEFFLPQKTAVYAGSVTDTSGDGMAVSTSGIKSVIEKTFARICVTDEIVENAGSSDCDWLAFSVGRYTEAYGGKDAFGNLEAYREALCRYVGRKYSESGRLHRNKATEWHRISLTLLACGGNPYNLIREDDDSGSVINLIADGTYNCVTGEPWRQGVNGAIYALITLDSMEYDIPDEADYTRDDILSYILSQELQTGGFSLAGNAAAGYDTDVTAMAVQALAGYYDCRDDVRKVVDRSIACFQDGLGADATYGNASSTAQVLLALTSAGIDVTKDERFITVDGHSIIDGIMNFYDEDASMFCLTKNSGPGFMATTQCLYALTGWCRQADGFSPLFAFGKTAGQPEKTPGPDATQKPAATPTPEPPVTEENPDTKLNPMQTQIPAADDTDSQVKNNNVYYDAFHKDEGRTTEKTKRNGKKKKTKYTKIKHTKTKHTKTKHIKTKHIKTYNTITDRKKAVQWKAASSNTEKSKTEKNRNDVIIVRDEAYITENELSGIIGTDSNILIDSLFDDTHRCLVTINGADVGTCRHMNLKASAGSGNASYDEEIMAMASGAFIFNVEDDNGIECDALYSIETSLPSGEYLLMRYAGGNADCVDKVGVSDGYLRFVIDRPGIYFVCKEVKVKTGPALSVLPAAADAKDGGQIEQYIAAALLAAAAVTVCTVIIMRRKKNADNAD